MDAYIAFAIGFSIGTMFGAIRMSIYFIRKYDLYKDGE